jgi:hypothetical protein
MRWAAYQLSYQWFQYIRDLRALCVKKKEPTKIESRCKCHGNPNTKWELLGAIGSRWSSGRSRDHSSIQCVASRINCKKISSILIIKMLTGSIIHVAISTQFCFQPSMHPKSPIYFDRNEILIYGIQASHVSYMHPFVFYQEMIAGWQWTPEVLHQHHPRCSWTVLWSRCSFLNMCIHNGTHVQTCVIPTGMLL